MVVQEAGLCGSPFALPQKKGSARLTVGCSRRHLIIKSGLYYVCRALCISSAAIMMTATVPIFQTGQSQAVRIPDEMEFRGVSELIATREGDILTLRPASPSWEKLAALPPIDGDFPQERPAVIEPGRASMTSHGPQHLHARISARA